MTIPEIDFPSSDLDFIKDPYPFMKDLREMSPVVLDKTTDLQLVFNFAYKLKDVLPIKNFFKGRDQKNFKQLTHSLVVNFIKLSPVHFGLILVQ